MDLKQVNVVCKEIARKTKEPKEGFTPKQQKLLAAHVQLWWSMLEDAFGVTDEG